MLKSAKRSLSAFLSVLVVIYSFAGFAFTANAAAPSASSIAKNNKTRHVVCNELSTQAEAYYTGSNTYENLIQLSGYSAPTDSASAIGSPLFNRLHSMMQPTNTISYSSLLDYWDRTDANNSSSGSWLFYADREETTGDGTNREHVWPKSHGNFGESGAGSDIHHLRPTNGTLNSTRGNYTMGNVRTKTGYTIRTKADPNNSSKTVLWYISDYSVNGADGLVEVADNIKGDIARIYLYLFVTYGSSNTNKNLYTSYGSYGSSSNDGKKVIESLDVLLEWNQSDPVDEWEMRRNDLCQDVQGNRNVFIDYPELAWYLFNIGDQLPVMNTPSGNANGASQGYVVNAMSSNENFGTVSIQNRTITATPKTGYYVSGYTVTSGSATVTRNGNVFTVVPNSDCTVMINFAQKDMVLLTLVANGSVVQTSYEYTGDPVTLPTNVTAPTGWELAGWVTAEVGETSVRPGTIYTTTYTPTDNATLYALFTKTQGGSGTGTWKKMTSASTMASGLQIVFAVTSKGVVTGENAGTSIKPADAVFSNNTITTMPDNAMIFTVGGQSSGWTFTSSAGQLYTNGAKNINFSNSGTGTWAVSISDGTATVAATNDTSNTLQYNASSSMFRAYTSNQTKIEIYYLDGAAGVIYYSTGSAFTPVAHTLEHHDGVPATCTAGGTIEYWYCTDCQSYFSDAPGTAVIAPDEINIAALGHQFETKWSFDGRHHWHECIRHCGETSDNALHTFDDYDECEVCFCQRPQIPDPMITGRNAELKADLTVNIYATIEASEYPGAKMVVTINGTDEKTIEMPAAPEADGTYKFTYDGVIPSQMNDEIVAMLCEADGTELDSQTFTLKGYLEAIPGSAAYAAYSAEKKAAMDALIDDLLVYGREAQIKFDHNTDNLTVDASYTGSGRVSTENLLTMSPNITSQADALAAEDGYFKNANVIHENQNWIRVLYTDKHNDGATTFTMQKGNGDPVAMTLTDGYLCTEGIAPQDYSTMLTFKAYRSGTAVATITYSVNTYCTRKHGTGNPFVDALYNYGASAAAFAALN